MDAKKHRRPSYRRRSAHQCCFSDCLRQQSHYFDHRWRSSCLWPLPSCRRVLEHRGLGCGTGFFIKSGTNNDGIHNGALGDATPSNPGPPAPARGSSVSLSNFTINGNQGNGRSGVSTSGSIQGDLKAVWYFPINLMNLNNVEVTNVVIVNSPSFHMRLSNVGDVTISGCVLRSKGPNTDGIHFDGPANDIHISNCDITGSDDAIALNCPEGYTGDISRVTVSNCKVSSWTFLMR